MTQNRRIVLNIVATYGRSLYALVLGLFTARWALEALGTVDYGLIGLIGGLTAFISYFNNILGSAIGRFYAVSVGKARIDLTGGLAECQKWFTTAVWIHTIVPICLVIVGYPLGCYSIVHWLTIPSDRVVESIWVWRFVCASCLVSMMSIPWNAMYMAKQYIAELTLYSFCTNTLNACFIYYMVTHPGVWITRYAFWQCALGVLPNFIIGIRAFYLFPECRVRRLYFRCWDNIKILGGYALWNAWGAFGAMLRTQGSNLVLNVFFGPVANAGMSVGVAVSNHCDSLSGSMTGAFSPAIYNEWGAGHFSYARQMGYRACRFGTLCVLVFALPLCLEMNEILRMWLKNPPEFAGAFSMSIIIMTVVDRIASGQMMVVNANGRIALYQAFLGTSQVLTLPIAVLMILLGFGPVSVGLAMVVTMVFNAVGRVFLARGLVQMSARYWLKTVVLPIALVVIVSAICGLIPIKIMETGFPRVCVTVLVVECVFLPLVWCFLLSNEEKAVIRDKLFRIKRRA